MATPLLPIFSNISRIADRIYNRETPEHVAFKGDEGYQALNIDPLTEQDMQLDINMPITSQYREMLERPPERNEPGKLRRVAAILSAFDSPEAVERALYSPYHRELEEYQQRLGQLERGSGIEGTQQNRLAQIANQLANLDLRERGLDYTGELRRIQAANLEERERQFNERETRLAGEAEEKQRVADARLKVAQAQARGGTFQVDDSGQAAFVFRDGSTIPIDLNYLSAEEKAALQVERSRAGQRDRIQQIEIPDPENPNRRIAATINLDTGEVTPARQAQEPERRTEQPTVERPPTELDRQRQIVNRANELRNSRPDWSRYITIDGGQVTITRPGWFNRMTPELYQDIYNAIYNPGQLSPRQRAIDALREIGITTPNARQIEEAIKDLGLE